jgi:hypothetical protein
MTEALTGCCARFDAMKRKPQGSEYQHLQIILVMRLVLTSSF